MSRRRILVAESRGFSARAAEVLGRAGELVLSDLHRPELLGAVFDVDVLWVRLRNRIDAEIMGAAPRLRTIVTATTGLDRIDLDEAARRGIHVLSLRGETEFLRDVRATAEHTIALMLALLRGLPAAVSHVKDGGWDRDRFRGGELHGATIGIVGYGRLGRIVARYLQAFDARVLAADPEPDANPDGTVTFLPLEELLGRSEIVTLHVNLTEESRGFFNARAFEAMKEGSWLVNTSRGELIDEGALLGALRSGRLGGVGLDTYWDEPWDPDDPLFSDPRVFALPHLGGSTREAFARVTEIIVGNVRRLDRGEPLLHRVA